jgi:protein SCO1/2
MLKKITKDYMAFYRIVREKDAGAEEYLVDHTAYIYLIDKQGILKLIYSSSKQKPELIAEDLKRLL